MLPIDRRTRRDVDLTEVEAAAFFADVLPGLLERNGHLAAAGMRRLGLRPLAVEVDGFARTFVLDGDELVVREGVADEAMLLGLDAAQFSDWAQEQRTCVAFLTAGDANMRHGRYEDFVAWDTIWRAILDGWAVHEPGAVTFTDRHGEPLDLQRSFTIDDDPADIAHFLREAGFLHLKGWVDPATMAEIAADIDRAEPTYTKGDGRSWWATLADGSERAVRLQHFHEHSPATVDLLTGETWTKVREACAGDEEIVARPVEGNCIEALIKPLGVVAGISDVPWHRDCSFGRHTYGCASLTVGVSVTAGGAESGQLRVVAGSHRANVPAMGVRDIQDLPIVPLPTEAGDLTVHQSCTLHEAFPPLTEPRKVMYSGFSLATRGDDSIRGNPQLGALREKAHTLISQPPSPVA
jgi:hypothetical protein